MGSVSVLKTRGEEAWINSGNEKGSGRQTQVRIVCGIWTNGWRALPLANVEEELGVLEERGRGVTLEVFCD
jgi:hypothetical protein